MDTSSDMPKGTLLADRYRLDTVIGRGGMATVYRARDEMLDRPVAVKLLTGAAATQEALERQSSEARIGAQLNHPGLVAVYDVHSGAPPFLVMELVEGMTLSDALERGRLRPAAVAEIGAKLCEALAAVHEAGVVHRDMKPSNVLIGDGAGRTVKLTDFGISRLVDAARITSTGQLIGTARYLSPEQASGSHVDRPTDVYAAGLVILECLTGEVAFPGTQVETLSARLHRDPEVPESLGADWVQVLRAMTAREPQDRPAAAAAAGALHALAEGRTPPILGPTPDPATAAFPAPVGAADSDATEAMARPGDSAPTAPIGPVAAGAAAGTGVSGTAAGTGGSGAAAGTGASSAAAGDDRARRAARRRAMIWLAVGVLVAVLVIGGVLLALQSNPSGTGGPSDTPGKTGNGDGGGNGGGNGDGGGNGNGGGDGGGSTPPSDEPTTEKPTEKPTTEKPTTEPTTEKPTTEPTTEKPTTQPTTEKPTTQPTTEKPTTEKSTTPSDETGTGATP